MRTFYTERDIVDLHATGVTEIEIDHETVLTDLAREKAEALGLDLRPVEVADQRHQSSSAESRLDVPTETDLDLATQVKNRVIARLGTTAYNDLLDQVIPQVFAQLAKAQSAPVPPASSHPSTNDY